MAHVFDRDIHCRGGVPTIAVGANGIGKFLVQRRAPDQNHVIAAQTLFLQGIDDDLDRKSVV